LLILDDFGLKALSTAQADDLGEIVSERYLKGGMLFTSNRRVEDWLSLFPDAVFANSVLDRMAHNAHQIVIEGESYRRNRRPEVSINTTPLFLPRSGELQNDPPWGITSDLDTAANIWDFLAHKCKGCVD